MNKLPLDLTYHKTGLIYSAYFLKGGLSLKPNRPNYEEKNLFEVIDTIARQHLSNVIRAELFMNFPPHNNEILMPHKKALSTEVANWVKNQVRNFVGLQKKEYLPQYIIDKGFAKGWEKQVFRRLDYFAERRITTRVIMNCGSVLRGWGSHWLNGDNNKGWHGRPTYLDSYGWTHWVHLKNPNYGNEDERARYKATMDYLLWMYRELLPRLRQYHPYVILDNNEIGAGATWHDTMAELVHQYGFKRKYMITSVRGQEWFLEKPSICKNWIPECHGINTLRAYEEAKKWIPGVPFVPCSDGYGERWETPEIPQLIRQSINNGNMGFQGNSEGVWSDMDYSGGVVVRNAFKGAMK